MEERDTNLDVDLDVRPSKTGPERIVRAAVAEARAYTRDGGAPVVSRDCTDLASFEREVERLTRELEAMLPVAERFFSEGTVDRTEPAGGADREEDLAEEPKSHIVTELRVEDLMTRDVKTVGANDRLSLADELMQVGRFRHLVVLDEDEEVIGVVSQRDCFFGTLAWALGMGENAQRRALETYPVKEVMASQPVVVDPEMSLAHAANLMRERRIGCLPVVAAGKLVGILTEGDFLSAVLSP